MRPRQHGRGEHHGQPVVAPAWSGPDASRTLRFGALLSAGFCLGSSVLGLLGFFY